MADTFQNLNPKNINNNISAYYQTRAAHHGVVTSDWLAQAEQPNLAEAVAAIRALTAVIRNSEATTTTGLEIELWEASDSLKRAVMFMWYVTKTSALKYEDFNSAKSRLIDCAEKFGGISYKARRTIAMLSQDFIFDGCAILVHGFSRLVLLDAPVVLLTDSAAVYSMNEMDMLFVGHTRLHLTTTYSQHKTKKTWHLPYGLLIGVPIPLKVEVETSAIDYTSQYLTLLFTDLGLPTPTVVSDELIQLYLWSCLNSSSSY
ncbi:hypothetical protein P3X46_001665 [Hevea brasiliensis]|uniref:Translation initiation factor eIF2B subunit alpha n=1 Tax=Hevea brasiliensis TaxID=3981 RepID=A0ABQ9NHR0_HEVBR|nr:hypothetical protein P3X46_001665 [Hevea brasiliensis]